MTKRIKPLFFLPLSLARSKTTSLVLTLTPPQQPPSSRRRPSFSPASSAVQAKFLRTPALRRRNDAVLSIQ
ncbi:hypothetical protein L6164_013198 [Bauhinia variegata]|uniref:Uncharacterized protein n=1 Tax=Bauhinia variegata TaxID=167791 RepID=A0ACB9PDS3_BAUVA|nr:hypothetical protein L6164_013198 [Bauhinia variegata]